MEEECDYSSDIGQLIQQMQKLCKKPQLDEQLSSALEVFQEKVTRQDTYLNNGIFNVNFAEAALFIQSCAELYGKKIDLLWDQLLELHTRLIEYDCHHEREKGKKMNQEVIQKLEERRNRYKRKKKFKLVLPQGKIQFLEKVFFEKYSPPPAPDEIEPFETDEDNYNAWRKLEYESSLITRIPKSVYKQHTRLYRMENYHIQKREDFDIYDANDGEFNTKYSRVPGWHHIEHLFEYNTKGLLPDKDHIIATLRLSYYMRARFMRDRRIPFNAPYSQYKDEYLIFKKQFFEEEDKKWQNMPLDTMADLRRQLDYLAKREREADKENNSKVFPDFDPFPIKKVKCRIPDCFECSEDSKSTIITISDKDTDKECDDDSFNDIPKCDLHADLDKVSTEIIDPKLRQDSGMFDLEETRGNETIKETSTCENLDTNGKLGDDTAAGNDVHVETSDDTLKEKSKDTENEGPVEANGDAATEKSKDPENDPNAETSSSAVAVTENSEDNENVLAEASDDTATEKSKETENYPNAETSSTAVVDNSEDNENVLAEASDDTAAEKSKETENDVLMNISNSDNSKTGTIDNITQNEKPDSTATEEPSEVSRVPAELDDNTIETGDASGTIAEQSTTVNPEEDDDFDVRSVMSDHDYCSLSDPDQLNVLKENKNAINTQTSKDTEDIMVPMSTTSKINPKVVKSKVAKENKPKGTLMGPPPPKRRKLSQKQIQKLMASKVAPVKEMKFEKFFSMNYQPQMGEGEVQELDYESEEDVPEPELPVPEVPPEPELPTAPELSLEPQLPTAPELSLEPQLPTAPELSLEPQLPPESELAAPCQSPVHDNDDIRSIMSDHSYCQPLDVSNDDQAAINDSGFIDDSQNLIDIETGETAEGNLDDGHVPDELELSCRMTSRKCNRVVDPEHQEEYERLLAELLESRRIRREELNILPDHEKNEEQKREQARLDARARVAQWKETITPILKNLKEQDFDIHEYGGKIMEGMKIEESKPFRNIVDGKSSAEVIRYFVASLQLANTYNIEICGAKSGELCNDTYNVKLLKTDRYHEHLTDYHAPSEDTFRERIKRMRELQHEEQTDDRNEEPPIPKRQRVDTSPKRRRRRKVSSSDDDGDDDTYEPPTSSTNTPITSRRSNSSKCSRPKRSKGSSNTTPNSIKGKNIVVKLAPLESTHHVDFSTPSTSGTACVNSSSPSPVTRSPIYEENFKTGLTAAQQSNPDTQMFSTPQTPRQDRVLEPVSSNVRILFE